MKCVIITAYLKNKIKDCVEIMPDDHVICADVAYKKALGEGITPELVIGDFDSGKFDVPDGIKTEIVPSEKDDTDTLLCVRRAIGLGYKDIIIVGGIGGRLDHTVANIQTLLFAHNSGANAVICDRSNTARILSGSSSVTRKNGYYFSVFAIGGDAEVTLSGVKYPLERKKLTVDFPLGISNEITSDKAVVSVSQGKILLIQSRDE